MMAMYSEKITGNRPGSIEAEQNPLVQAQGGIGAENLGGPLIDKVQGNPEFTRWWKRWVSRVQRMGVRKNALGRTLKLERHDQTRHRNPDMPTARGTSRDCEFKRFL
jgi:hypothetical protein